MSKGPFRELSAAEVAAISKRNRASRTHILLGDSKPGPRQSEPEIAPKAHYQRSATLPATDPLPSDSRPLPASPSRIQKRLSPPQIQRKRVRRKEAEVLRACQDVLKAHPAVALFWRQNTGAIRFPDSRFVKFSFRGASDLMGILRGGRFLAVECKAPGRVPTALQHAFLDNVRDAGGLAVWVDDAETLAAALRHAE